MAYKKITDLDSISAELDNENIDTSHAFTYVVAEKAGGIFADFKASLDDLGKIVAANFNVSVAEMKAGIRTIEKLSAQFEELYDSVENDSENALAKIQDISSLVSLKEAMERIYQDLQYILSNNGQAESILTRMTNVENAFTNLNSRLEEFIAEINAGSSSDGPSDEDIINTADIDAKSGIVGLATSDITTSINQLIQSFYTTGSYDEHCVKFTTARRGMIEEDTGLLSDYYASHHNQTGALTANNWFTYSDVFNNSQSVDESESTPDNSTININNAIKIYSGHLSAYVEKEYGEDDNGNELTNNVVGNILGYKLEGEVQQNCLASFNFSKACPWKFLSGATTMPNGTSGSEVKPLYCHLNVNGNTVNAFRCDSYVLTIHENNSEIRFPDFRNVYTGYLSAGTKFSIHSSIHVNVPSGLSTSGFTDAGNMSKIRPFCYLLTKPLEIPNIYSYEVIYHYSDCTGENYYDDRAQIPYEYDIDSQGRQIVAWPLGDELDELSSYSFREKYVYNSYSRQFTINRPHWATTYLRLQNILMYSGYHPSWNDVGNQNWDDIRVHNVVDEDGEAPQILIDYKKMQYYVFDLPDSDKIGGKKLHYTLAGEDQVMVDLPNIVGNQIHLYLKYNSPINQEDE